MVPAQTRHQPVLAHQAVQLLNVRPRRVYVDCTVGLGGHAHRILQLLGGSGRLLGLDRDAEALEAVRSELSRFENFTAVHENFKNLAMVLRHLGIGSVDGCLVDLGVSSLQLDTAERGFSFRKDGPLDMRMDVRQKTTAADLVNGLPEQQLAGLFRRYGQERAARKIAAAIVERRRTGRIRTTGELARVIEQVKPRRPGARNPATRVFQALRIEVNQELSGIEPFLNEVIEVLAGGGRLVVISFHSLEDRIVKTVLALKAGKCICFQPPDLCACPRVREVEILTRKPLRPGDEEIRSNPRARSARLRAVEKLENPGQREPD